MLAEKAVIFTHLPYPMDDSAERFNEVRANKLINRVIPYYKAYLACKNVGLVYVFVDTGLRQMLKNIATMPKTIEFSIDELDFEHATRNCLMLAIDKATIELEHTNKEFDRRFAPKFQFVGLPHLFSLLKALYRIDPNLVLNLAGDGANLTYDSPKFIEAVIRLARGAHAAHSQYPILRFDEDVMVNERGIGELLTKCAYAMDPVFQSYSALSG